MITAQVVLINKEGLTLGVSRKDNHNDFGLPGGKADEIDYVDGVLDPARTAIRECKEETGLDISNLRLVFAIHKSGNMGYTYLADWSGEIEHDEPHVVKWVTFETLINGGFGRYNKMVSESLTDMGIDYVINMSIDVLTEEINQFLSSTTFSGYNVRVDQIRRGNDWLGRENMYTLYLKGAPWEMCENDDEFIKGIDDIAKKHGINITVPSDYYSK